MISTKVMTTPSILSSTVRYGRMRTRYQLPLSAFHFVLEETEFFQHAFGVAGKSVVFELMREVGDRTAFVASPSR